MEKPLVELTEFDGNACAVLRKCIKALRKANTPKEIVDEFIEDAQSGNYDHLLQTAMNYCDIEFV